MRKAMLSPPRDLALRTFGRALVPAALLFSIFSIACSSSGGSDQPAADGGAQDGGTAASDAADASDGADPSSNADPTDNDPASYERSLDVVRSWIYFDKNQPWVRVEFNASWPPPATLYYWSCAVSLGTANAPVATFTAQDFNGTRTDTADGIDKAKITFVAEPRGFRVRFADATLTFDHYGLESSVKTMNTGTLAQDTSGVFPVTTKMERAFAP